MIFRIGNFLCLMLYFVKANFSANLTMLYSPSTTNSTTVDDLERMGYLHIGKDTCINFVRGGTTPHSHDVWRHPRNPFVQRNAAKMAGTTVWINEWMTVGHGLYDSILLQILASTRVDRIVLQRSSHDVDHLGDGLGTWQMWFKNVYASMIMATRPGVPIYIRFREPQTLSAHVLSIDPKTGMVTDRIDSGNSINLWQSPDFFCGERIITRNHDTKFAWSGENAFSPQTISSFRKWAYLIPQQLDAKVHLSHHFPASSPIVIAHHYRHRKAGRHMNNVESLRDALLKAFPLPTYEVRSIETTEQTSATGAVKQILDVAETQVWITEHGATQSNLLFLRNGSFLLDMRGPYFKDESGHIGMVRSVCQAGGVFFDYIYTSDLKSHEQQSFSISEKEIDEVIQKVRDYLDSKVYSFNVK